MEVASKSFKVAEELLNKEIELTDVEAARVTDASDKTSSSSRATMIIVLAIGFVVAIALGIFLTRKALLIP